jgi:hypothetical protein
MLMQQQYSKTRKQTGCGTGDYCGPFLAFLSERVGVEPAAHAEESGEKT